MNFIRTIVLRDNSCLLLREFHIEDIISVYKMYSQLSNESKKFLYRFLKESRSWLRDYILLIISYIPTIKSILMMIFPKAIYLALCIFNSKHELVAFTFFQLKKRLPDKGYEADGGSAVVRDDYQNRGLGSYLYRYRNEFAYANKIQKVSAIVDTQNLKAIHLNKKHGFQIIKIVKRKNALNGKTSLAYEMVQDLRENEFSLNIS